MGRKTRERHAAWRAAEVGGPLPKTGAARVCAVYPGPYRVAMANLGYQWLLRALSDAGFAVARVVWPEDDLLAEAERDKLTAIDDDRPASDAAAWFVSLSFENDLPRLAGLLRLAGLATRAGDRQYDDPLIVAGGVVPMLNPEPTADLVDLCLLGEGDAALSPFLEYLKQNDPRDREHFLRGLRDIPGAYVGRFYRPHYRQDGRLERIEALDGFPERVTLPREKTIDPLRLRTHLRAPDAEFGDALLVETAKGCVQRCRFCAAGHLFLPFRPAPPPGELPDLSQTAVGLVGANVSGHGKLADWIRAAGDSRVTLSSIRVGALDDAQWRALADKGLAAAAIAPEAGSERLRRVCNKPLDDERIIGEVRRAVGAGLRNLKLYFLIGLPTETPADIDAIIALTLRCRDAAMDAWKLKGRAGKIVVSVNPFVPKPHTPFQWEAFGEVKELKAKVKTIREGLRRTPNVEVQAESLDAAALQAILSVGDRRIGALIRRVDREGIRPALRFWKEQADFYLNRPRAYHDLLPWDHLDVGVTRQYLIDQHQAALHADVSPPCFSVAGCRLCGVCK